LRRPGSCSFRHPRRRNARPDAAPAKPPAFLEVPDMLVNLSGSPGEPRAVISRSKIVLEVKEERQVEAIQAGDLPPRLTDIFQDLPARAKGGRSQRLRGACFGSRRN